MRTTGRTNCPGDPIKGQEGPWGVQAEQGEVCLLPQAGFTRTYSAMQGVNASASPGVVLLCPVVTVLRMELKHPDNPFTPGILKARVLSM